MLAFLALTQLLLEPNWHGLSQALSRCICAVALTRWRADSSCPLRISNKRPAWCFISSCLQGKQKWRNGLPGGSFPSNGCSFPAVEKLPPNLLQPARVRRHEIAGCHTCAQLPWPDCLWPLGNRHAIRKNLGPNPRIPSTSLLQAEAKDVVGPFSICQKGLGNAPYRILSPRRSPLEAAAGGAEQFTQVRTKPRSGGSFGKWQVLAKLPSQSALSETVVSGTAHCAVGGTSVNVSNLNTSYSGLMLSSGMRTLCGMR